MTHPSLWYRKSDRACADANFSDHPTRRSHRANYRNTADGLAELLCKLPQEVLPFQIAASERDLVTTTSGKEKCWNKATKSANAS